MKNKKKIGEILEKMINCDLSKRCESYKTIACLQCGKNDEKSGMEKIKVELGMKCWNCKIGILIDKEEHSKDLNSIYTCSMGCVFLDGNYQPIYKISKNDGGIGKW